MGIDFVDNPNERLQEVSDLLKHYEDKLSDGIDLDVLDKTSKMRYEIGMFHARFLSIWGKGTTNYVE